MDEFQCQDCESWFTEADFNVQGLLSGAWCCPVCGEGQGLEYAPRRDSGGFLPSLGQLEDYGWNSTPTTDRSAGAGRMM